MLMGPTFARRMQESTANEEWKSRLKVPGMERQVYIPGIFMPASLLAKLGLLMLLNILRIWAYCLSS